MLQELKLEERKDLTRRALRDHIAKRHMEIAQAQQEVRDLTAMLRDENAIQALAIAFPAVRASLANPPSMLPQLSPETLRDNLIQIFTDSGRSMRAQDLVELLAACNRVAVTRDQVIHVLSTYDDFVKSESRGWWDLRPTPQEVAETG